MGLHHHSNEIFYAIQSSSNISFLDILIALGTVGSAVAAAISAWIMMNTRKDEFVPVVIPEETSEPLRKGRGITLKLRNVGKGMAKNVYVYYEGKVLEGNYMITQKEIRTFVAPASDKLTAISGMWEGLKRNCYWTIEYSDIYDRKYRTSIMFTKNRLTDIFHMDRGKWEWSRRPLRIN